MLATLLLSSGALLFSPDTILGKAYLLDIRDSYGSIIGTIFLVSGLLVLLLLCIFIGRWVLALINKNKRAKARREIIKSLNDAEKRIVMEMYNCPSRSLILNMAESITNLLEAKQVIARGSYFSSVDGDDLTCFSYYLQPWAIKYIYRHGDLQ